jgi:regulator of sirC expression with transglutaminase-like and TPR domain
LESRPQQEPACADRDAAAAARLTTLGVLLDDPSPTVWRGVRRQLEALGGAARPALRAAARGPSARARARARLLLLHEARHKVARRLARYLTRSTLDLERGLLLLSRFEDPRLDLRPTLAALDALGAEVAGRVEDLPPGLERGLELARYLGSEVGLDGDREDYHHPDNVFLHRAVQRGRGLPLTLTAVYLLVARRAGVSAAAVPLPGHVLLRLHGTGRHVLVDPFRAGARVGERDCLAYLARRGLPFRPQWFADATDDALLERQVRNLRSSFLQRGLGREVGQLELVLGAFERRITKASAAGDRT